MSPAHMSLGTLHREVPESVIETASLHPEHVVRREQEQREQEQANSVKS